MNEDKNTKFYNPSFSFGKREDPGDEVLYNPIWRPVFGLEVAYASEFVCRRSTTQDIGR